MAEHVFKHESAGRNTRFFNGQNLPKDQDMPI